MKKRRALFSVMRRHEKSSYRLMKRSRKFEENRRDLQLEYTSRVFPLKQYLIVCTKANELLQSRAFTFFILMCIFAVTIIVGVQTYPGLTVDDNVGIFIIDQVIFYAFVGELVIRILAEGVAPLNFLIGEQWQWNIFDLTLVILSSPIIPIDFGHIKMLRLIRLLRLIKVFRAIAQLQTIVLGLYGAIQSVFYILILFIGTFYLYAIVGQILFRDNDPFNFQNFEISFMTLLRIATLDGWGDIFYINFFGCDVYDGGVYSSSIGNAQRLVTCDLPKAQPLTSVVFFLSFIVLTVFCVVSLFIYIVSSSITESMFDHEREMEWEHKNRLKSQMARIASKYEDRNKMSRKIKRRASLIEMVFHGEDLQQWEMEYDDPRSCKEIYQRYFSFACQDILDTHVFHYFITCIIFIAAITAGFDTDPNLGNVLEIELYALNWFVQAVFVLELVLKIGAEEMTPWVYLYDPWNTFDFIVVCVSFVPTGAKSSMVTVFRMLRLLRVLKLAKEIPDLQVIVVSVFRCSTSIGYILLLLLIFYYFFAVTGVTLFSYNDPWHFGTLHLTMFVLFVCSTQDNWSSIAYITLYGCDKYPGLYPTLCDNPEPKFGEAMVFWVIFIMLGSFVVLALFIGMVGKSMEETKKEHEALREIEKKAKAIAHRHSTRLDANTLALYKEVFDIVDFTHSNRIGKIEMRFGLSVANIKFDEKSFSAFWQIVDSDRSETIDFSEFLLFIVEMEDRLKAFSWNEEAEESMKIRRSFSLLKAKKASSKNFNGMLLSRVKSFKSLLPVDFENMAISELGEGDGERGDNINITEEYNIHDGGSNVLTNETIDEGITHVEQNDKNSDDNVIINADEKCIDGDDNNNGGNDTDDDAALRSLDSLDNSPPGDIKWSNNMSSKLDVSSSSKTNAEGGDKDVLETPLEKTSSNLSSSRVITLVNPSQNIPSDNGIDVKHEILSELQEDDRQKVMLSLIKPIVDIQSSQQRQQQQQQQSIPQYQFFNPYTYMNFGFPYMFHPAPPDQYMQQPNNNYHNSDSMNKEIPLFLNPSNKTDSQSTELDASPNVHVPYTFTQQVFSPYAFYTGSNQHPHQSNHHHQPMQFLPGVSFNQFPFIPNFNMNNKSNEHKIFPEKDNSLADDANGHGHEKKKQYHKIRMEQTRSENTNSREKDKKEFEEKSQMQSTFTELDDAIPTELKIKGNISTVKPKPKFKMFMSI